MKNKRHKLKLFFSDLIQANPEQQKQLNKIIDDLLSSIKFTESTSLFYRLVLLLSSSLFYKYPKTLDLIERVEIFLFVFLTE